MPLTLSDFNYNLPPGLIAQNPAKPRNHSRLLVLDKRGGDIKHDYFYNIFEYLCPGDVLVVNNSKVFPARLIGKTELGGGQREIFLHHQLNHNRWECLVKGRTKIGLKVNFSGKLQATLTKDRGDGTWEVEFNQSGQKFLDLVDRIGQVPLPPYIKRDGQKNNDKQSYQTVYADEKKRGSVAAPTAGLHFTPALLRKIKKMGVEVLAVTLHVGLGTFATVKSENISEHEMHSELVEMKTLVQKKILKAKSEGRRIVAVGTTSCRTLETWGGKVNEQKKIKSLKDFKVWTNIFIYPPYKFKVVDALITNFHLPKSSLLMLVSALAGKHNIDKAYQAAIKKRYRFFSYGDAMFIR
ncbi:MAG: tRNA preQ1(34) S-adenosylmethionine ribosyltransferase-isomerase QueA [Patescibacteria group bacterium]